MRWVLWISLFAAVVGFCFLFWQTGDWRMGLYGALIVPLASFDRHTRWTMQRWWRRVIRRGISDRS